MSANLCNFCLLNISMLVIILITIEKLELTCKNFTFSNVLTLVHSPPLKPSPRHLLLSDFSYAIHCPQQHSLKSQITTEHKSYQLHKSMKNRSFHVHVA